MKVHHLNCGTMHMPTASMVCHVLLVETDNGLVLVDSGFGTDDCTDPARVGPTRHMVRAILRHEETVARQIEQMGLKRDDVRHIIITHLDMDHAGGLSDFPAAQIHITAAEARGAIWAPSPTRSRALPRPGSSCVPAKSFPPTSSSPRPVS